MRSINAEGRTLVQRWEGLMDGNPDTVRQHPYLDHTGIWVIGWGHPIRDTNGFFLHGARRSARAVALYPEGLTVEQAEALLTADLLDAARDVLALVTVAMTDNQFSALVSFEHDTGALKGSMLLKKLNAGNYPAAGAQFSKWAKGRDHTGTSATVPGLVHRRRDESNLFLVTGKPLIDIL